MRLHEYPKEFKDLVSIVAMQKHLPEAAIIRDYYIVMLLKNLADSEYSEQCVFKGGTSLSKCYPGSIERFSEDIDLTFLGMEFSDKLCNKTIKQIENIMTVGANVEKIDAERSNRSKSMYVWFDDVANRVKLEIGSSVRPDPYSKKVLKSYIQEFLEENGGEDDIHRFELKNVTLNVLNIERTFVDKLMSVKRHTMCGNINTKVRHIYDVVKLFEMPEIKTFLNNSNELQHLIRATKDTDFYYLEKRNNAYKYNPTDRYDFETWRNRLDTQVQKIYENLHKELLYTDEQQSFDEALYTFEKINAILQSIGE